LGGAGKRGKRGAFYSTAYIEKAENGSISKNLFEKIEGHFFLFLK